MPTTCCLRQACAIPAKLNPGADSGPGPWGWGGHFVQPEESDRGTQLLLLLKLGRAYVAGQGAAGPRWHIPLTGRSGAMNTPTAPAAHRASRTGRSGPVRPVSGRKRRRPGDSYQCRRSGPTLSADNRQAGHTSDHLLAASRQRGRLKDSHQLPEFEGWRHSLRRQSQQHSSRHYVPDLRVGLRTWRIFNQAPPPELHTSSFLAPTVATPELSGQHSPVGQVRPGSSSLACRRAQAPR